MQNIHIPRIDSRNFNNYNPYNICKSKTCMARLFRPEIALLFPKNKKASRIISFAEDRIVSALFGPGPGVISIATSLVNKGVEYMEQQLLRDQLVRLHRDPARLPLEVGATLILLSGASFACGMRESTSRGPKMMLKGFFKAIAKWDSSEIFLGMAAQEIDAQTAFVNRITLSIFALLANYINMVDCGNVSFVRRYLNMIFARRCAKEISFWIHPADQRCCTFNMLFEHKFKNLLSKYPRKTLYGCFQNSEQTFEKLRSLDQEKSELRNLLANHIEPYQRHLATGNYSLET